jgi:hypothetical protein
MLLLNVDMNNYYEKQTNKKIVDNIRNTIQSIATPLLNN